MRIVGALVRLGDKARALPLLDRFLADRRPPTAPSAAPPSTAARWITATTRSPSRASRPAWSSSTDAASAPALEPLPALEDLHVVGALVGGGVGAAQEAHAAAGLGQGAVAVLFQPARQLVAQAGEALGAAAEELPDDLHGVRPRHHRLDRVDGRAHAAGRGERGAHAAGEDGEPAEA